MFGRRKAALSRKDLAMSYFIVAITLLFGALGTAFIATTTDMFSAIVFLAVAIAVAAAAIGISVFRHAARLNSVEQHFYQAVLSGSALFFVQWARGGYDVTAYVGSNRVVTFRAKDVQQYGDLILFCGTFLAVPAPYVQIISVRPQAQNGAKVNRPKK
jgi:hypothetical protein